jgi:hypothetical protein
MPLTESVARLVAVPVAATAILVVGTLAAAEIVHFGRRGVTSPVASHPPRQPSDMSSPLALPRDTASSTPEQVEQWGMDSFPASDPPQNW